MVTVLRSRHRPVPTATTCYTAARIRRRLRSTPAGAADGPQRRSRQPIDPEPPQGGWGERISHAYRLGVTHRPDRHRWPWLVVSTIWFRRCAHCRQEWPCQSALWSRDVRAGTGTQP
jgi:hypothetical protein